MFFVANARNNTEEERLESAHHEVLHWCCWVGVELPWSSFLRFMADTVNSLNGLTVANRVHILEPQWNPAVESQAIGRFLRIGQQKKVTVVRYAMLRSIEEVGPFTTDQIKFECHTLNWSTHFLFI